MELFVMQMEKKFMNFMENGMKHFTLDIKKQKKKENFGDSLRVMNFGHIHIHCLYLDYS